MTYKTNTPNYKSKNVNNFSDFLDNIDSEKTELKDLKRSINPNSDNNQKYPKNSKFKFNKVTRKMDDLSLDEVDDKIDSISESKDNLINSMSRFLEDYATNHTAFEKRGMDEGIEILRNSSDLEEGILNINKKIEELTKKEKEFMPQDQKEDMIKGLKDLVKNLESKSVSESHVDDDMFLKLTNKPSYKKLISDMRTAIDEYLNTIEDTGFDEGDNDHYLALSSAVTEACNTALEL
jgi:hypothetical protein